MSTTRCIRTTKLWLALTVLALLATACSSSVSSATVDPQAETAATEVPATAAPEVADPETVPNQTSVADQTDEPEPEVAEAEDEPVEPPAGPVLLDGLDAIAQVTPSSGNGTRPLLAWEPAAGAEFYSLVLYAPDGEPYWGSLLNETETFVGGPIQIDEDKPGPRVIAGMTWSVVGLDVDMVPVASSPVRPIAP